MAPIDKSELEAKLSKFGQQHVLKFWDTLSDDEKQQLHSRLSALDLAEIQQNHSRAVLGSATVKLDDAMEPLHESDIGRATELPATDEMKAWEDAGVKAVSEGKVAALLLAGGQGTRLGSSKPKGMFPLELPSGYTLFALQAKRLLALQNLAIQRHGKANPIPWYIMTSGSTMQPTIEYFEQNGYFGLNKEDVKFFEQLQIPCLTGETGKMILKTPSDIARAPDGNGGLYEALVASNMLDDMTKRGIEHVHVYCVDNILVKVADPMFIGFCSSVGAEAGAKVVGKKDPFEAVGVVCKVSGKYQVVEYSEISEHTAKLRGSDGELTFNAGNICNHYFTVEFLKLCGKRNKELKHHVAHKKIPYVNDKGETVKPTEPNGIKMEKFVFDVFQFARKLGVLEVDRHSAFSPLKNAYVPGEKKGNTVATCRRDLYALHREYLSHAGAVFVDENDNVLDLKTLTEEHVCEIDASISYAGEGLESYCEANPRLKFPVSVTPSNTRASSKRKAQ